MDCDAFSTSLQKLAETDYFSWTATQKLAKTKVDCDAKACRDE